MAKLILFITFFVITLLIATTTLGQIQRDLPSGKIHNSLKDSLLRPNNLPVNIFVGLKNGNTYPILEQVELSLKLKSSTITHEERTSAVYNALNKHSKITQKSILKFIKQNFPNIKIQSFYSINQIYLKNVDKYIVETLAGLDEVSEIQEEKLAHIKNVYEGQVGPMIHGREVIKVEWALDNMRVPYVWNMTGGNNGDGLLIGNIDTGVRGTHELLKNKWVGNENNGWYDPEGKSQLPHDVYNHGTHTMGTLIGDDGIGIAPGAKWLACKGYQDNGWSLASTFIACIEYMLCPNNFQGNNPDCSKAPHVVSNSWGWTGNEPMFNPALRAWNVAGIVSSFSAGNTGGSGCVSIYSPADQPDILAVGATDNTNKLATFSSLGPSPSGGQIKPEISAPGVAIFSASATSDIAYMTASGTSMSCPCATGVLALLKNRDRNLSQARATNILQQTAIQNIPSSGRTCGGIRDDFYPNNHVGHGKIDAQAAMQLLISQP